MLEQRSQGFMWVPTWLSYVSGFCRCWLHQLHGTVSLWRITYCLGNSFGCLGLYEAPYMSIIWWQEIASYRSVSPTIIWLFYLDHVLYWYIFRYFYSISFHITNEMSFNFSYAFHIPTIPTICFSTQCSLVIIDLADNIHI